jgi:hypothetical protein
MNRPPPTILVPRLRTKPRTPIKPVVRFTPAKHRRPKHPHRGAP